MQISLNWLKQHVEGLDKVDPQELGLKLTMATVEVESVENQAELLIKVVVGKIVKLEKHPDADRLQVAQVDIGNKKVKVVCGGSNLKQNMLVAMALSGAKVRWHGEGELVELKSTKVRGVESDGMICAGVEIGLDSLFPAKAKNEIVDLSVLKLQVGQPLADALGLNDVIFEIDNKSLTNRPDLWGHYGIAREVAAIVGSKLKPYKLDKFKKNKQIDLKVKIDDFAACPRYMAIALEGVKISESPDWLKKQLEAIGQKSINNIVDITNYVMYDLGQPLHAFSADKIVDNKIIVRKAIAREKITTLDGEARKLIEDDLLITDNEKPIALAGVMGNQNSEINTNTNVVIIESATFEPFTVRKTADRLDLRSEAAIRFEKNLDPNLAEIAINKAVNLIQEVIPEAKVVSNLIDESKFKLDQGPISLSWEFIDKRIGEKLEQKKIIS
ncbi:phenylalanine--tRNA ligase subunit beta, partial [Candidatus Falkowbacteria bacterium]|nr:phenylalanine--tRNA ligase subunit beta [Candidatus Falkowbacteria bacterium]